VAVAVAVAVAGGSGGGAPALRGRGAAAGAGRAAPLAASRGSIAKARPGLAAAARGRSHRLGNPGGAQRRGRWRPRERSPLAPAPPRWLGRRGHGGGRCPGRWVCGESSWECGACGAGRARAGACVGR
ncbi:unnamed protein product, partial [Coccothraustes coccothraustes]